MLRKKNIQLYFKILLSAGLLWWLFSKTDTSLLVSSISRSNPFYIMLVFFIILLNRIIMAYKWNILLHVKNIKIKFRVILKIYFISTFLGVFLPPTVGGDTVRLFYTSKEKDRATDILASIIIERFIGLLALLCLSIYGTLSTFLKLYPDEYITFNMIFTLLLVPLLVVALFCISFAKFPIKLSKILKGPNNEKKWRQKLQQRFVRIHDSYTSYRDAKFTLFLFFGLTILESLSVIVWNYILIAYAFDLKVDFTYVFAFVPILLALIRLPISLDGFGIHEGSYAFFLGLVGVSSGYAFGIGLTNHFLTLLGIIPGGFLYAFSKKKQVE